MRRPAASPINVGIVIYPQRLGRAHPKMLAALKHDPTTNRPGIRCLMGTFVENGLRAQARSGNLLTGQLYIASEFFPKAPKVTFDDSRTSSHDPDRARQS